MDFPATETVLSKRKRRESLALGEMEQSPPLASLPSHGQLSAPDPRLGSSPADAPHWRKLRLLEARLLGHVLQLQDQENQVLGNTDSSPPDSQRRSPVIITETMAHDDRLSVSKTNSSNKSQCTIIPASPGREAVSRLFPGVEDREGRMTGITSQEDVVTQQPFEDISTAGHSVDALWMAGSGSIPFGHGHGSQPFGKREETIGYSSSYFEDLFKSKNHSNQSNGCLQSASETGTPTGKRIEDLKKTKATVADDPGSLTVYSSPSGVKMKRIDQYFFKKNDGQPGKGGATKKKTKKETKAAKTAEGCVDNVVDNTIVSLTADMAQAKKRIEELELALSAEKKENESLVQDLISHEKDSSEYQRLVDEMKQGAMEVNRQAREYSLKARDKLVELLKSDAIRESRKARQEMAEKCLRLASVSHERRGIEYQECWREGYLFQEIQDRLLSVGREKDTIEKNKKTLMKRLKMAKSSMQLTDDRGSNSNKADFLSPRPLEAISLMDYNELDEIARLRLAVLKKEESDLLAELDKLATERDLHMREVRRIKDEDQSRFNNHPIFNDRYILLCLIGKGGFSEVYKAYDLQELRLVACKIHSLSDQWTDERKKSYIKHSLREYHIHKSLDHPRVVKLYDVFELDHQSFCTVLEFVEGTDLESYLSTIKTIPEKEAHSILVQVMSALRYMNELKDPIIHYDLKPANILYYQGQIKITDFGLSKVLLPLSGDRDDPRLASSLCDKKEMALTSQGAGTYWYLPPEVFVRPSPGQPPISISSKVDVWSLGCIFYELLYGLKPFGHNKSQQTILKESTIMTESQHLTFPPKPVVSVEARDFIKKCLEYRKDRRPDVLSLAKDSYICHSQIGRRGAVSSVSAQSPASSFSL